MSNAPAAAWVQQVGGDVSIVLGAGHGFVLKSDTLRKHSEFFADTLVNELTEVPEPRPREAPRIRWRLELVERPAPGALGAGVLELLPLNDKGQTLPGGRRCPADTYSGGASNPIYTHYKRVLGALYGEPFTVQGGGEIEVILNDVLGLLEVAEYLGCVSNISHTLETSMLNLGVELFKNIASNPCNWARLAVRVRSAIAFKEAVIHIVGRWQDPELAGKDLLPDFVKELCLSKHKELFDFKKKVEQRIVNFYPKDMTRDPEGPAQLFNRTSYANEIFTWMASTCAKQWFASVLVQDMHRHGPDGGYWLYSKMGLGGHAYITESEMADFHKVFPMSQKGRACFQERMLEMKQEHKLIVRPLLRNESQLDPKEMGLRYLTCCKVNKDDYPWLKPEFAFGNVGTAGMSAMRKRKRGLLEGTPSSEAAGKRRRGSETVERQVE